MNTIPKIVGRSPQIGPNSAIWTLLGVDRAAQEQTGDETGDLIDRAAAYLAQLCHAAESVHHGLPADASTYLVSLLTLNDEMKTLPFSRAYAFECDHDRRKDDIVVWWPSSFHDEMNETVRRLAPRCALELGGGADA